MAILRSYSATFEQTTVANAAVARWRFNEDAGSASATDSIDALDGSYEAGADPGAAGTIGDGAAQFDGDIGRVLVANTLSGTITVSALGDSLIDGDTFQPPQDQFSPVLEAVLEARGLDATVLERAENGQRTGDALNPREGRFFTVGEVTADSPDVVILELGTNDAGGKIALGTVESNLTQIIDALQDAGINQILLTSTFGAFPGKGTGYNTLQERADFEALFPAIAQAQGIELLSDPDGSDKFLGGVRVPGGGPINQDTIVGGVLDSTDDSLQVGDGLHPNAAGVEFIVERVVPQTLALGAAAGVVDDALELANGSIELWFTPDSVAGTQVLFSKDIPGVRSSGDIEVLLDGSTVAVGMQTDSGQFSVAGGSVATGVPAHVVFTFGDGGMNLFVDGLEVAQDPSFTGGTVGNFAELAIGARDGGSAGFDGVIDEVAVYDRALTAGEIQRLFDGGELGSTVVGTAAADTLLGGSDSEIMRGLGGADLIIGRGGDDVLRGNGGDDDLRGGTGDDKLFAGYGHDKLSGGVGDDMLAGFGGNDRVVGGAGEDLLKGYGGADWLVGGADADRLFGGLAIDRLSGGGGDDLLNGGLGTDILIGGPGGDTFEIARINHGVDKIRDFAPGEGDVLDLSAVLDFSGGDDPDNFVQLNAVSGDTHVDVNPDGAGGGFTTVFNLIGTTGLNLDTLVADGNVQLESAPAS